MREPSTSDFGSTLSIKNLGFYVIKKYNNRGVLNRLKHFKDILFEFFIY